MPARSRETVRAVAHRLLTERRSVWIVPLAAARLAYALGDSALIARILMLARDRAAAEALGVTDAAAVSGMTEDRILRLFQSQLRRLILEHER